MKKAYLYIIGSALVATCAVALTVRSSNHSPDAPITVKSTAASRALIEAAKDILVKSTEMQAVGDKATANLKAAQKDDIAKVQQLQSDLTAKLKADPKYKPTMDEIDAENKKISDITAKAQADFDAQTKPYKDAQETDKVIIVGVSPVVRTENGLPPDTKFDVQTQTWVNTAKK